MKKFLGITFVLLLVIGLIGGISDQNQQSSQLINDEQPMEQFVSTGDKNLDNTLSGIDYDLNNLQSVNKDSQTD